MTRSVLHSRTGSCLLLLALAGWTAPLLAQTSAEPRAVGRAPDAEVQRAEAYAAEAFDAYGRKEYERAVALYRKAYEISPTADILYNVARIYDVGMKDRSRAIEYYHRYVADSEAEATHVEIARERLTELELRERPAMPPAGAAAEASETPDANVEPPAHTRPALVKPAHPPEHGGAAPLLENDSAWTPLQVGAIVAGTVGLVGIGLGAGFGVAALSDANTARDECDGNVCSSQRGVDAVHDASKSADIATVGFALGGTLLATSIALLWIDHAQKPKDSEAGIAWMPIATDSQLGLSVSRSW